MLDPLEIVDVGRHVGPSSDPIQVGLSSVDETVQQVLLGQLGQLCQLFRSQSVVLLQECYVAEHLSEMNDFSADRHELATETATVEVDVPDVLTTDKVWTEEQLEASEGSEAHRCT